MSRVLRQLAGAPRPRHVPLELPTQSAPGRYKHDGSVRLINCYAENAGREGKIPFPVFPIDGQKAFSTLSGTGECRGLHDLTTELLAVYGRQLFSADPAGTATAIAGIAGDSYLTFATNRATVKETAIVGPDGLAFVYSNGTLTRISDTDLPPANSCDFLDGYILYFIPDGRVFFSGIDNATSIGANDFFTAEGNPDGLVRGAVHQRTIYLLGEKTTELWENTGDATTPFQRLPGGFFEFGCLSGGSVAKTTRGLVFIDDNGAVVSIGQAGGFDHISTHPVERSIREQSDKSKVYGWVEERDGREFYVLTGTSFTWVYDFATGQWHERESETETRWRAQWYAKFNGKRIVGDFEDAALRELDPDTYDEGGNHLIVKIRFPIHAWPFPVSVPRLRFDMIPGQGLASGNLDDTSPDLMMRVSRNGGVSFGNEKTSPIGKIGQYRAKTEFAKLGTSDQDGFVVEASVSAAVIRGFTGVSGDVKVKRR